MKKYEVGFVFFIESDNVAGKDALLDELDLIDEVTLRNVYNDGEDWNIECVAEIESKATKNIDEAVDKKLRKLLPNVCWDYHYIKGIDNDYYWQP
jgi:hypothetical protein